MAADVERMAKMETQIIGISDTLAKIDGKLDAWNQNFVPRNEINEMFRSRDDSITEKATKESVKNFEKKINGLEREQLSIRKLWPAWLGCIISIISLLSHFMH